ncbi:hypothetical protein P3T76_013193 [Phytophthora citrophthora]|uniref:Uncharacterized protein n=1 Tax=Phytophthora citrophthora TaxID=4793 RepID=A0AAD9G4Q7_9STRA|nr:hypothetical protein P3T76_013193 [Phytophthora citrophthora]
MRRPILLVDSIACGVVLTLVTGTPYALPPAPAKHPANVRANNYDPSAPWDYSVPVNVEQLHDVRGEYPHRCFLVEWQITPLQLSWVWEEQLAQRFARRIDQVMQWFDLR